MSKITYACEEYMLPKETTQQIVGGVLDAVKGRRALATRLGIPKSEQDCFAAVFERQIQSFASFRAS